MASDGARVETIARRARVNKGLIFYHFQSKDQLLRVLSQSRIAAPRPSMNAPEPAAPPRPLDRRGSPPREPSNLPRRRVRFLHVPPGRWTECVAREALLGRQVIAIGTWRCGAAGQPASCQPAGEPGQDDADARSTPTSS